LLRFGEEDVSIFNRRKWDTVACTGSIGEERWRMLPESACSQHSMTLPYHPLPLAYEGTFLGRQQPGTSIIFP
jgi:hypothetical protein